MHHNAAPVAELTLALLLAAARAIVPFDQALRQGDWRPRYARSGPSVLLDGKTAVILGYGAIGQRVARLCQALGMSVLATRRNIDSITRDGVAAIYPTQHTHDLLPLAHALIICLPLTPETEGLMGAAELARLPHPCILVNIGRGPIVDEAALYTALHSKQLHAAGLDVWYNYPSDEAARLHTFPGNYPFHELDNVVLSPHRGGGADTTTALRMSHLADLLNAAARREPIPNRVDLQTGY
ncbi:MAG: NAD(P)-dependent oxidoreductase [Chloroflexota bacterium]